MTANFRHPIGRRFHRYAGGAGAVSRDTARDMAGVSSDAELDALVAAGEISPPLESSLGPRYFPAELADYAARKRRTRNK